MPISLQEDCYLPVVTILSKIFPQSLSRFNSTRNGEKNVPLRQLDGGRGLNQIIENTILFFGLTPSSFINKYNLLPFLGKQC